MAKNSPIEWTDATWNPWHGCIKISEGCKRCYMYTLRNAATGKIPGWWSEDDIPGPPQMDNGATDLYVFLVRLLHRAGGRVARRSMGHHPADPAAYLSDPDEAS